MPSSRGRATRSRPPRRPPSRRSGAEPVRNHVGGAPIRSAGRETFTSINPATGEVLAEIEIAGEAGGRAGGRGGAGRAGASGRAMTGAERGRVLKRVADLLRARNEELARLETLDTGKPIQETSAVDVLSGADCIEYFAGLAGDAHRASTSISARTAFGYTRREPLGIVAGIGAWNYPLQIACWKAAPALACGNAMIFKPAELTPLTAVKLAEIMAEAGVPDGVFNVVQGFAETGRLLTRHPDIAKVSLTGEVGTGKAVMADAAADPEARHPGARRQVAADRLRRRRPRRRGLGRASRQLLLGRRGLLERHPRLRAAARARGRLPGAARRAGRAACGSATRSTRRPRSAR